MKRQRWKNWLAPLLAVLALFIATGPEWLRGFQDGFRDGRAAGQTQTSTQAAGNEALYALMAQQRSGVMVAGEGVVQKVLKDDNEGSRHQRFILDVGQGKTLLIAHNIDVAPRVPDVRMGESVRFYGQYESNAQGGVLHWTHHDPAGRHAHGWLEYQGKRYQ